MADGEVFQPPRFQSPVPKADRGHLMEVLATSALLARRG